MATKSKGKKDHRKKVQARNQRLAEQKRKNEKFQREFIMNLIKQEQEKGLFNNPQSISQDPNATVLDGPMLNSLDLNGPILDGPILDGPILDTVEVVDVENLEDNSEETKEDLVLDTPVDVDVETLEDSSGETKED